MLDLKLLLSGMHLVRFTGLVLFWLNHCPTLDCVAQKISLLEKASKSAEEAARSTNGNFLTKLQAFRLWVVTEYMHEVGGGKE